MKNKIIKIFMFIVIISIFCGVLTACAPNTKQVAGEYELIEITSDKLSFKDFAYCDIMLDDKGGYVFEYKILNGEKYSETGTFTIENECVIFGKGSIEGTYEIDNFLLKIDALINNQTVKALFVLREK